MRTAYRAEFTKEYILSIPKTINENGCWIPPHKPKRNGYVTIGIGGALLQLHRVVLALWYNIDYNDQSIDTRHNFTCDRRCFNPEHIKPGTHVENMHDGIYVNKLCPKCGGPYNIIRFRHGPQRGKTMRRCPACRKS